MGMDRQWLQELNDSISHSLSCLALDLSQESQATLPFRQGDNGMATSFADDRIHFPITQTLTLIRDRRPFVDAHPVFELTTPVITSIALPALFPWSGSSTGIIGGDGDLLQHVYLQECTG